MSYFIWGCSELWLIQVCFQMEPNPSIWAKATSPLTSMGGKSLLPLPGVQNWAQILTCLHGRSFIHDTEFYLCILHSYCTRNVNRCNQQMHTWKNFGPWPRSAWWINDPSVNRGLENFDPNFGVELVKKFPSKLDGKLGLKQIQNSYGQWLLPVKNFSLILKYQPPKCFQSNFFVFFFFLTGFNFEFFSFFCGNFLMKPVLGQEKWTVPPEKKNKFVDWDGAGQQFGPSLHFCSSSNQ